MIISRTPFRVSLFGGGSDYPTWYRRHGGTVFGMAINKYCYISVRELPPFFEHKHRLVYSRMELVNDVSEIEHPAVRAVLEETGISEGLEIHHDGDLPARSGLGSSSSFTVGLLNAISALNGRMASKRQLAEEAIRIEQEVICEHVGSQDQIWAAYGGMNRIDFNSDGSFSVSPIIVGAARRAQLMESMLLFFTGFSRNASEVAKEKIANLNKRQDQVRAMASMVDEAISILESDDEPALPIGRLLGESWRLKRELASGVSNSHIDEIYTAAIDAGAIGGKLLGAGRGGFMLFLAEPDKHAAVKERLKDLVHVGFDVDMSGSTIVVYEPDGLDRR